MTVLTVTNIDNQDSITTLLTLSNGTEVEVDVVDLYTNMVENNYEGPSKAGGSMDTSDIQAMVDYLNGILNQQ